MKITGRCHPKLFLEKHKNKLVILDEIHKMPEIFQELRGIIDEGRQTGYGVGRFLILGSAALDLLKQSGETLAGRVEYIHLNPLDIEALRNILTEPKNSLVKQYTKLFEYENVKLNFDNDVLDFIVNKAMEYKLGARGLRSICEAIMLDAMYDTPSNDSIKELHITLDYAIEKFEKADFKKLQVA